ncbi:hypothetical protein [Pelagibacterium sp.]|uniref:hypothetical protein n=1 Tax=Pelagibacterium sp. TaxID=1967288 RepID=UPI003A90D421
MLLIETSLISKACDASAISGELPEVEHAAIAVKATADSAKRVKDEKFIKSPLMMYTDFNISGHCRRHSSCKKARLELNNEKQR